MTARRRTPNSVVAAFGLAVASACGENAEPVVCPAPTEGAAGAAFVDVTEEAGVQVTHQLATDFCELTDTVAGPGVCLFDADGDGDLDLFTVDRAPGINRLLQNDGRGRFEDVSEPSGLASTADSMGCLAFDANGDGALDLYVTNNGPDQLFLNDGGTFHDATEEVGLDAPGFSISATAGDIDADGDLDVLVARVVELDTCPDACFLFPLACQASTNLLLENRGGRFVDVAAERGLTEAEPTLAVLAFDMDGDGDVDLYAGNDMGIMFPDRMYINDGTGHFTDRGSALGLDAIGTDTMGVDVGDYDLDGRHDLVITDFKDRPIRLFNCFDPAFPCSNNVAPDGLDHVKWGVALADFDHDGALDLFVATGDVASRQGEPSYLYFNEGEGRFRQYLPAAGEALAALTVSRGAAFGDIDGDLDVDVVIANVGGPLRILQNDAAAGHALLVELDAGAVGAVVTVATSEGYRLSEHVLAGGSYASSSDPRVHFGLGDACVADVSIRYVGGATQTIGGVRAGQVLGVSRAGAP